jgi:Cu-Zn family superoxide dismutase
MSARKRAFQFTLAGMLVGGPAWAQRPAVLSATADLAGCTDPSIVGRVFFFERPSAEGVKNVDVTLFVRGLPPGKHAVHVHEVANCTPCASAGGHFDPGPASLSSPDGNHPFHSGDLINVDVNPSGFGFMATTTSRITLSPGPLSVFDTDGSSVIVHVQEDTYCPGGPAAGCAGGARAACGIVQR